jgi:hypothetical protein
VVVVFLILCSEECDQQLPEAEGDGSGPEEGVGVLLVEEAHGDDEENGDCAGDGVEEVELRDGDVVQRGQLLLHGLRLIQNEVVPEHHQDQKDPQMDFLHLNIIPPHISEISKQNIEFI